MGRPRSERTVSGIRGEQPLAPQQRLQGQRAESGSRRPKDVSAVG